MLASRTARVLFALASSVLLSFTVSLHPVWWAAWFAPLPLLLAMCAASTLREATLLAYGAAIAAHLPNLGYYRATGLLVVGVAIVLLQAALWVWMLQAARRFLLVPAPRAPWFSVLVYPVSWAALDTVVTFLSPHSSFGSLAYSQGGFLPALQVASLTGTPGVVFLPGLTTSLGAFALWRGWRGVERPALAYGLPLTLLALALGFGLARVDAPLTGQPLRVAVGLAAIDDFIGGRVPAQFGDRVWAQYALAVGSLAAQGARVVLLPEKIEGLRDAAAYQKRTALLSEAARQHGVFVAAGMAVPEKGEVYNRQMLFDPAGQQAAGYDKHHLVPGLEAGLTPGTAWKVQEIDGVRYGLAICKDLHFPSLGRAYGRLGVDAMLDPAWDFQQDAWMAARLTAVRGIESGFAILRSSREGLLTVTDRRGRVLAETASAPFPGSTLAAKVEFERGATTFYAQYGDVFGWTMVALAVALRVAYRTGRYQRDSRSGETPSQ